MKRSNQFDIKYTRRMIYFLYYLLHFISLIMCYYIADNDRCGQYLQSLSIIEVNNIIASTMQISGIDFSSLTSDNICTLINNTLSGDNQKIGQATKILKAYTKHNSSIILASIMANSQNVAHRQMSTVLMKRNLVNLYFGLTNPEQAEFRAFLINQYVRESSLAIQRGIATLIGILLPVVEIKNWLQLQKLLDEAVHSAPNSIATFILLNCLLYHFKPPKELNVYLFNALKVPNLVEEALKCLNAVAQTQDIDESLAVQLIKVWETAGWPQEISLNCLEILNTMAERRVKMNEQIIQWVCIHVVSNKKLSTKFRVAGLDFLSSYAEFNAKALVNKEKLLKKVVETICQVCSQPFGQEQLEEGQPVQQIALWFIETLSISLKSKKIYPVLLEAVTSLINAQDIHKNNTGFLLLGSMAQGCSQRLKKNLQNPVMNVLIPKGLSHQAPEVRGAAISALSYFSEYLIPDIVEYHATIIPEMMKHINDMSSKVAEKALIAVDVFFDNMEEDEIKSYLPVVIPTLSQVVRAQNSTDVMRNASMSGIGTAIEVSKQIFEQYVPAVYGMCIEILKIAPSPQHNAVRAQNVQVLAKICNIFCKSDYSHREQFYKTYAMPVMEPVYHMLTTENDPQVRESCFMFFYLIANAIQTNFSVVFDKILPEVFKSAVLKAPQKTEKKKDFSLDSDSQDEDNYLTVAQVSQFDQKSAAIRALGELANACPANFAPYFDQSFKILDEHHQFFYDSVRIEVSSCYINLIKGKIKSLNNGVLPPIRHGLPVIQRYPEQIQKLLKNQIIPKLIFMMTQDESNRSASQAIQSLDELIKALGPVSIDHSIDKITRAIIQLLQSQEAEEDDSQDQEQQEDDDEDADAYIFEPLCGDLIPTLAQMLQGAFLPELSQIFPYLCKFLEERQNINENVQMTGCISQLIKHVPSFFSNFGEDLFKSLASLTELHDTDLNRNIAFCFAEAIEKSPEIMKNYLEHTLFILKNIFEHKDSHQACKDNALAGICKAIIAFAPPMPYEMFIATLISSMPFKGDEQEQGVAIRCIMSLSQTQPNYIKPYVAQLIAILQNDLQNPKKYKLEGEFLTQIGNFYQLLKNSQ